jgi:hypothetical protein
MLAALLACSAQAAPRAVLVEPRQTSIGQVEPDRVQHYKYTLRNAGDSPLAIQALDPTCYCTTAKADAWDVPPGGSTTLHVTIDPSDFVGGITKGVEVVTNDPKDPRLMIEVAMDVRPGIAVVPPELDFGPVPAGGSQARSVDLKTARERPFQVQSATAEAPYLTVQTEPFDSEYRIGTKLVVKVGPNVPPGPFATQIVATTTDPAKPRIEIPVRGVGPGGLTVTPDKLVFEAAAPGSALGTLVVSGGKPVTGVRTSSPMLLAAVNGGGKIDVKLADNAKPGRLLAKVFVKTADAAQAEITVPVIGVVK